MAFLVVGFLDVDDDDILIMVLNLVLLLVFPNLGVTTLLKFVMGFTSAISAGARTNFLAQFLLVYMYGKPLHTAL